MRTKAPVGFRVKDGGVHYFVQRPEYAMPQHIELIRVAVTSEKDKVVVKGVEITKIHTHAECAPYVILQDEWGKLGDGGIFYTKWSPLSPVPLEVNHDGVLRFKVLDFAEDLAEAIEVSSILRNTIGAQKSA